MSNTEAITIEPGDLIRAADIADDPEFKHLFNKRQFQWIMRNRERNGLNHAVIVMGARRLFISRKRFSEWLANQAEA